MDAVLPGTASPRQGAVNTIWVGRVVRDIAVHCKVTDNVSRPHSVNRTLSGAGSAVQWIVQHILVGQPNQSIFDQHS